MESLFEIAATRIGARTPPVAQDKGLTVFVEIRLVEELSYSVCASGSKGAYDKKGDNQ